jgi:hypothetical protein
MDLDKRWSGLFFVTPSKPDPSDNGAHCGGYWNILSTYLFVGGMADATADIEQAKAFNDGLSGLFGEHFSNATTATVWESVEYKELEVIYPFHGSYPNGIPSVAVQRETIQSGTWLNQITTRLREQPQIDFWMRHEIYDDLTGHHDSTRPGGVSISANFRKAQWHYVFGRGSDEWAQTFYDMEPKSYISESEYGVADWKTRYWDDYDELLAVKKKYDSTGMLICDYCIGYGEDFTAEPTEEATKRWVPIVLLVLGGLALGAFLAVGYVQCIRKKQEDEVTRAKSLPTETTTGGTTIV